MNSKDFNEKNLENYIWSFNYSVNNILCVIAYLFDFIIKNIFLTCRIVHKSMHKYLKNCNILHSNFLIIISFIKRKRNFFVIHPTPNIISDMYAYKYIINIFIIKYSIHTVVHYYFNIFN